MYRYRIHIVILVALVIIILYRVRIKRLLMSLGLWGDYRYFELSEFDDPLVPGSGKKYIDRRLVRKLDNARLIAGIPFKITSGYRTKFHNTEVGGVKDSSHMSGLGADIGAITVSDKQIIVNALLKVGFKRIGYGERFIHADIDKTKKQQVIWSYGNTIPSDIINLTNTYWS